MNKKRHFLRGGIQREIFALVLGVIIVIIAAYTAVIAYEAHSLRVLLAEVTENQKNSISSISGETMKAIIDKTMGHSTEMEATIADNMFLSLSNDVKLLKDSAEKLLQNPEDYKPRDYAVPDPSKEGETTLQLLYEDGTDLSSDEIKDQLSLYANLSDLMESIYSKGQINACYIAIPEGAMLLTDRHSSEKYAEDGTLMTIPIHERDWYRGAMETGSLFFTDVVQDAFTDNVGIMCSIPVWNNGKIVAVIGADLYLDSMARTIADSSDTSGFNCIVNNRGHVIFSPQEEGTFQVKENEKAEDLRFSSNLDLSRFISSALQKTTDVTLLNLNEGSYYACGAPIGTIGWSLVSLVSQEALDQPTAALQNQYESIQKQAQLTINQKLAGALVTIVILVLIIAGLGILGALILSRKIVRPLKTMTDRVGALGGDNLQFLMEKTYETGNEIEVLANSFAALSAKTLQYVDEVRQVTAEKERIGAELDVANEIQASQLPRLFPAFPNRKEFDIYASMTPAKEVGGDFYDFFLVDNDHIALVMADVSGKGVPAALFMMISRVLLKARIQNGESPAEALSNLNNQLCESNEAGFFVTIWVAILDLKTGQGIAANAGHEHPALRRKDGNYELVIYRHSMAVATMEGIPFREHEFKLEPGDSFFVYTDGVAEATNAENELYGTDRMLAALNKNPDASPEETLENVSKDINEFVGDAEQFDDLTMLCVKYLGPDK
ncbi:MAG: SpoIIE family protein phosphatase [Parasporobacterium sp.]|nr:SpoIIE family protein phosphatase [Parasporobacterium sp.]